MRNAFAEDLDRSAEKNAAFRAWDSLLTDIRKSKSNGHFEDAVRKVVEENGAELDVSGKAYTIITQSDLRLLFMLRGDQLRPIEETEEIKVNTSLVPAIGSETRSRRAIHRILGNVIAKGYRRRQR